MNQDIEDFILAHVEAHPRDIGRQIQRRFEVSRQTSNKYLNSLVERGLLTVEGKTKGRKYQPAVLVEKVFDVDVEPTLAEDDVWRNTVATYLSGYPQNVVTICQHGFTEMVNNVIDHSGSPHMGIDLTITPAKIEMTVRDFGVGIFSKIQNELGLANKWESILELSKGKLTTDSDRHTGEGIFFTSRMFDEFAILSDELVFFTELEGEDWLVELEAKQAPIHGTHVGLELDPKTKRSAREIFNRYEDDDHRFTKTHVPVQLARYEGEDLLSRSQAKRLVSRFERFTEVLLDFRGVNTIGQAFADELFRVFANRHPSVHMTVANVNDEVQAVIRHVLDDHIGSG